MYSVLGLADAMQLWNVDVLKLCTHCAFADILRDECFIAFRVATSISNTHGKQ